MPTPAKNKQTATHAARIDKGGLSGKEERKYLRAGLILAVLACIAAWLALPQVQNLFSASKPTLPTTPVAFVLTTQPTQLITFTSPITPSPFSTKSNTPVSSYTPTVILPNTAAPTLQPTDKTMPTSAPSISEAPAPIQGYTLPFSEPSDIVYDNASLWAVFADKLVKLEPVGGENRFQAVEQIEFPIIRSLDWDIARNQYWAVSALCDLPYEEDCFEEIELINRDGTVTATFTVSQTLDSSPVHLAWDGEYLWLTSLYIPNNQNANLYKLQVSVGTNELKQIDSFGLPLQWGGENLHGLVWDGTALWVLDGYILKKLDSSGQQVCEITLLATLDINWWGYQGITWDGQFLWVVHAGTNTAYRVDPKMCN